MKRLFPLAALAGLVIASSAAAQDSRFAEVIFDRMDVDANGEISTAEMVAAKERQFGQADADGDGLVTAAELAAVGERIERLSRLGSDALSERALRLDRDGDSALSLAEYTGTSPFFTLIDADGNGAISRAEFDRARAAFTPQP